MTKNDLPKLDPIHIGYSVLFVLNNFFVGPVRTQSMWFEIVLGTLEYGCTVRYIHSVPLIRKSVGYMHSYHEEVQIYKLVCVEA